MTSDGTRTFGYDYYNRLATVSGGVALNYDGMGRLVRLRGTAPTVRFLYDGVDMIAEYNASHVLQRRYVHGPGTDEPLVEYAGSGTGARLWLIADERGSIVARTNQFGTAVNTNSYDEYGLPAAANAGRYGYTGQVWLEETGLYHYKNRAYNPRLGRFMQTDPIGQAGGMNIYAYVGGDPVNYNDPLGLDKVAYDHCVRAGGDSFFCWNNRRPTGALYLSWTDPVGPSASGPDGDGAGGGAGSSNTPSNTTSCYPNTPPSPAGAASVQAHWDYMRGTAGAMRAIDLAGSSLIDTPIQELAVNLQFLRQVGPFGAWDYKHQGIQYDAFANYIYGVTAHAAGLSEEYVLRAAGAVQEAKRIQALARGQGYNLGHSRPAGAGWPWDQQGSFGDNPNDTPNIINGYQDAQACN